MAPETTIFEGYTLPHIKAGGPVTTVNSLQGIPDTLHGRLGIGLAFDYRDEKKTYDHPRRFTADYTHATFWMFHPDRRPRGFSFRADTADMTCFFGVKDYWGPLKLAHPGIWTPQPGRVYPEKRLHDVSWVRPIANQERYDAIEERLAELRSDPPLYQVTSVHPKNLSTIHTLNCMSFAFQAIEASGVEISPLWKLRPWPIVIAQNVAFGARLGLKGNNAPHTTIQTFQAAAERLALPTQERIVPIRPGTWNRLPSHAKTSQAISEPALALA